MDGFKHKCNKKNLACDSISSQSCFTTEESVQHGRDPTCMREHLSSDYMKSLSVEQRSQYLSKLKLKNPSIDLPDPYKLAGWVNNMKEWPNLTNSYIHQYLLYRQLSQTQNEGTACASLAGYNAFKLGNVQEVEYSSVSIVFPVCFLKAIVMSSYEAGTEPCLAWVCFEKTDGTIKASHCTCLKRFERVCSHIAGLLFKVEAAVELGMHKEDSDRGSTSSNRRLSMKNKCGRSRLCVARVKDTFFMHQNSNKGLRRPLKDLKLQPLSKDEQKKALIRLRKIVPNGSIFPKEESDTDTASEVDWDRDKLLPSVQHSLTASGSERELEHFSEEKKEQLSDDDEANSVVSALDFEGFDSDDRVSGHGAATPLQ